uniref:Cytochrome P450 n=1 Tax=Brachionus rotundiformis TaxID=96890 RepID=A0A5J6KA19_9BILA|nr:cytochrome P450 [Brachionus rotundiformis]
MKLTIFKVYFNQIVNNSNNLISFLQSPLFWLKLVGSSVLGFSAFYIGKIWFSYRFFKKIGIKTPKYTFFYGNNLQLTKENKYSEILMEWTKKFGKTYGYYQGHLPILVTSDLDIIQEVFVKQSKNFSARKRVPGSRDDKSIDHMLFTASGTRWKIIRNIVNPTFSSAKLRDLSHLLIDCTNRLNLILEKEQQHEIDISEFTMDSIWSCAFGIDANIQQDPQNEYNRRSEAIFSFLGRENLISFVTNYLHEFENIFIRIMLFSENYLYRLIDFTKYDPLYWFMNHLFKIVEIRKLDANKRKDYLQLLIDAEADIDYTKLSTNFNHNQILDKKLSTNGIKLNLISFMLAGYETTSSALTYACYILVKYQHEQNKLYNLIKSNFNTDEDINSEDVLKIDYLDLFLKEVLRFYPIANPAVNRRCTQTTWVKGIKIPKDLVISIDVMSLHFDSELWGPVDPYLFYPERHQIKRNPLVFMSFGNGPRYCLGMKFALLELKIALCKLLLNFEFLPAEGFPVELEVRETIVRRPKNGLKILLKKRG